MAYDKIRIREKLIELLCELQWLMSDDEFHDSLYGSFLKFLENGGDV